MDAHGPTPGAVRPLAGQRILVVDDQPSIRGVLQVALEDAGALVTVAEDGAGGLDAAMHEAPDLVMLDIDMPGMDGWDVLGALARVPRTASIPVVLQAAANDFESFERARRHGVAAFVSKPFRLGEVVETCRRVIHGARPLLGRDAPDSAVRFVEVDTGDGRPPRQGRLVDYDARGAQIELDQTLPVRTRLVLRIEGSSTRIDAEVRWTSSANGTVRHGVVLVRR